jgi:hypothetical protein
MSVGIRNPLAFNACMQPNAMESHTQKIVKPDTPRQDVVLDTELIIRGSA